ncbi:T9SS type A sorting domain-containing protein [Acidiluteibacter ferrifornacis]|uniref:T9SS type A sorting domain-containing protein n=1 Tax=Acidiluteibacter ferrifornacis TaxID=2692424 RepID=A0A6N9NH95_9FLAO|nr:T9SS type A sorting domain-containing protein [Acidiluteibacter ferrifornacis]NBG66046.1 T9SS type A sorting domain-containing protein [Acidiluteibacter ferrifornacis]
MRLTFLILILFVHFSAISQFGPGGVGNVTNNGLWLKASNYYGTSGDPVAVWNDTSGNNNDAIQLITSQQPVYYSTSSLNNQPIIRLDGSNDQMQVADADILDNSAGLTFFAVIRGSNIDGTPRGILGKRRDFNTSTNYSYTWFFHTGRSLFTDIETQNNRFSTAATYSSGTNYILSLRYDGTSPSSSRVRVYTGETLSATGTEASATIGNSNQPLTLGALNKDYSSYLGADYAEVIQYNFAVNTAQRIIINNYLSAQYNISLSANNVYINDEVANGNYDYEVAGIGRVDASNIHSDAQGSSAPRFLNPTDLNDGEFMLWGHDNATGNEYSDIPAGIEGRMNRVWRISERNTSGSSVDVGTVDLRWDLSKGTPATAAHLRLLIDTDNDGLFSDETPISGATSLGGNQFEFSGVSLIRDSLRFTLASIDTANTPLPVTWLNFYGEFTGYHNLLKWTTISEINNDFFSIEKSKDGNSWEKIGIVSGHGNSTERINYQFTDFSPNYGENYYRLKQVDFDGKKDYSEVIIVNSSFNSISSIYPNPANSSVTINTEAIEIITLLDALGRKIEVPSTISSNKIVLNTSLLKEGLYFIRTVEKISGKTTTTKILIQH